MQKLLFLTFIILCPGSLLAQEEKKEADLKAVFIYNFTLYTEWDDADENADFTIGVIGSSAVTASLQEIAGTKTVNGRKIVVETFDTPGDVEHCNILFIPAGLHFSLASILARVDKGMLTVSEQDNYASQGTAFNFFRFQDKLKFECNLDAIAASGLKVGSQLLKLAKMVK